MFRVVAAISFRHAHPRVAISSPLRSAITHGLRFNTTNSSSSPDFSQTADTPQPGRKKREMTPEEAAIKAGQEKLDDMQRDWDSKRLSYEELLPRTQSPSPVRSPLTYITDRLAIL